MSLVFDIPSHYDETIAEKWYNTKRLEMKPVDSALPELEEGGSGGGFGGGRVGGRGCGDRGDFRGGRGGRGGSDRCGFRVGQGGGGDQTSWRLQTSFYRRK